MFISAFKPVPPPYQLQQAELLRWLSDTHAESSPEQPGEHYYDAYQRFGCGPDRIARRGTFLADFTHRNRNAMAVYSEPGRQASIDQRQRFYQSALLDRLRCEYQAIGEPEFANWIHVTCTGYISPSVVQTLISENEWGHRVRAQHAYHMGCYASLPALRMARGDLDSEILHTELCTLHLDTSRRDPEQLVIQSLFADGVVRYRATRERPEAGFEVLDVREQIAPGTLGQMAWAVSSHAFAMTLARQVPLHIKAGVHALVKDWTSRDTVFAVHPGGPRVIDAVKEALGLSEEQVGFSRDVLRRHGNMSSATLPHVWAGMLEELPVGTPVVSLAFGPGLTLAGSYMRRV